MMETVSSSDGTTIAFERLGSGTPLVLVHGTLARSRRWPILPALEEEFTIFAMDRRGRGDSGDAREYALQREAEDAAAVVDAAGADVHLFGHSYGGVCAIEAALVTKNLRSLVVYEPAAVPTSDTILQELQTMVERGQQREMVIKFMLEVAGVTPQFLETMMTAPDFPERVAAAHTVPREGLAMNTYRIEPHRFREIDVPIFIMVGSESPHWFRENAAKWQSALPHSEIIELPGERHSAHYTSPELFVRELKACISSVT